MKVRLHFNNEQVGAQLSANAKKQIVKIRAASRAAAQDVVDYVVPRARQNISSAGRFGSDWTQSFQGKVTEGGGNVRVAFTMGSKKHPVKYWRVFQNGAVIRGRPLLWIPLSFAKDAKGVLARNYPGKLFRVNRAGKAPLLLAAGKPAQPKYFGKPLVKIPKKFRLIEIVRDGAKKLGQFYKARMKQQQKK